MASADYVAATDRLAAFWTALGSKVERMDAQRHDLVLAVTSHIPHLIAYNMVATAYDMEAVTEGEVVKFSAAGFRDFTRIAASDPTMWRDVFLNNKEAVLEVLGRFEEDLTALRKAIRNARRAEAVRHVHRVAPHPPRDHRCGAGHGGAELRAGYDEEAVISASRRRAGSASRTCGRTSSARRYR